MTAEELAEQMTTAIGQDCPRVRISQLEPCAAVARGVFALIDSALGEIEATGRRLNTLERREAHIKGLELCLRTWQACGPDGYLAALFADGAKRSVTIYADMVTIHDPELKVTVFGDGACFSAALGKALNAFDAR